MYMSFISCQVMSNQCEIEDINGMKVSLLLAKNCADTAKKEANANVTYCFINIYIY